MLKHQILEPQLTLPGRPLVILFTTTAKEALEVSPLCHPANFLSEMGIRVLSFDLPLHHDEIPSFDGVKRWTQEMQKNANDLLLPFLKEVSEWMDQNLDPSTPIGIMGISRGGLIAALLASIRKNPVPLTLFSPMMDLDYPWLWDASQSLHLNLDFYRLKNHFHFLKDCPIYFSIGNNDERVYTKKSLDLYKHLVEEKAKEQTRNILLELHVFPSIGMYGHGTPDRIFQEGTKWMKEQLTV
jgi:dienelactone hydrolase